MKCTQHELYGQATFKIEKAILFPEIWLSGQFSYLFLKLFGSVNVEFMGWLGFLPLFPHDSVIFYAHSVDA